MECPRCRLINHSTSLRCDCGYDFRTGTIPDALAGDNHLPLASLGDRVAGQFFDTIVAYGGLFLGGHITRSLGITSAPAVVLFVLYLLFADGLGRGQSLGKKLMNTAVVDEKTGAACSFGTSFLRNAVMLLGVLDWGFIFGVRRQRLGDKAASTIVVKRPPS
jgi:uncharacterized RDD family membrane protein YckC